MVAIATILVALSWSFDYLRHKERRACAHKDPIGKFIIGSTSRYQNAYYAENQTFIESIEQFKEIDPEWISGIEQNISDDSDMSLEWQISSHSQDQYATASVFLHQDHQPISQLRFYTGVTYQGPQGNYQRFICSGFPTQEITEIATIPPLVPTQRSDGQLQFECPKGTREDC